MLGSQVGWNSSTYLQGLIVVKVALQDMDIASLDFLGYPFLCFLLVADNADDYRVGILRYLAKKFELVGRCQLRLFFV